jgi:uncharacterized protein (TIGR03437 family)
MNRTRRPLNRAMTLIFLAGSCAWAQIPSVPSPFQPTYTELQNYISSFDTKVTSEWNGKTSNVLWSTELDVADANSGLQVLNYGPGALMELQKLHALGLKAVTVGISMPIVNQDFYTFNGDPDDFAPMVAFYANLATQIHNLGMKMIVESDILFTGPYAVNSGFNLSGYYASLSADQYVAARVKNVLTVAQQIGPDYILLNTEPDTDLALSGQSSLFSTASEYAGMTQTIISQLKAAGVTIPLGAGVDTWLDNGNASSWVTAILNTDIDFFDLHTYPINFNYLDNLIAYTDLAQQAGKPVTISEAWLLKESDGEYTSQSTGPPSGNPTLYGRDPFSFWAPLDQAYLSDLVNFANWKGLVYISPFWTRYFWAYLNYSEVGSLTAAQVSSMAQQAASAAIGSNQTTITGLTYSNLIQGVPQANAVSAASFVRGNLAPDSMVSIFGSNLSAGTESAPSLPLPAKLDNTTASIQDSSGNKGAIPFIFVSPGQINAAIPTGLSAGGAVITISSKGTVVAQSDVTLATVAPAIFTANQNGKGVPIAVVTTAQPNGSESTVDVFQGSAVGSYTPAPINLGGSGDSSALVLYGTGIRGRSSLSNVTVTIGTVTLPVQYAGRCDPAHFAAFDQVNVALPHSLAGIGQVTLTLTVDGVVAPPVTLDFQ